jgi:hypothetical protein
MFMYLKLQLHTFLLLVNGDVHLLRASFALCCCIAGCSVSVSADTELSRLFAMNDDVDETSVVTSLLLLLLLLVLEGQCNLRELVVLGVLLLYMFASLFVLCIAARAVVSSDDTDVSSDDVEVSGSYVSLIKL